MRQFFACGLAIAASLAWLSPGLAQETYNPITTRYNSILNDINAAPARSIGYRRHSQEAAAQATPPAVAPQASSEQATPSTIAPQPAQANSSAAPACDNGAAGSYEYGNYFDANSCGSTAGSSANWVVGVYGLVFRRDYEDDRGLSAIPANLSQYLNSTSAKMGSMGGIETVIGRRGCDGRGWEARYWGLYPETAEASLFGSPYTNVTGLSNVVFGGNPVSLIYNRSVSHFVYRDNTFHNFEFNLLRSLGTTDCGKKSWEWFAGFRYFSFDEDFNYATFSTNPLYPPSLYYQLCTENKLYGFQVGTRNERCLNNRLGYQFGSKVGIYGNHIEACQAIHDGSNSYAEIGSGPYTGTDYNFESSKDDFSMMGELNLGLTYQLNCKWRAVGGYRALGVSGIALAPDQIPYNFTDTRDINRIKSNGSLILHGSYFGLERCF